MLESKFIYKLRIRTTREHHNEIIALLNAYSTEWIFCYEDQDSSNPHIHACLKVNNHDHKRQSIVKRIKRSWPGSGNRFYSLVQMMLCEEDEECQWPMRYLAYCLKQGTYYEQNIPKEVFERAKELDAQIKKEIKEKKDSRENKLSILGKLIEDKYKLVYCNEELDEKFQHWEISGTAIPFDGDKFLSIDEIVRTVINYYLRFGFLIRHHYISALCRTLCLRYVPNYEHDYAQKVIYDLKT